MSRRPPPILGVASDLDGTLLTSQGVLSPCTTRLLGALRDQGIPLVVATARTPRALRKIPGHEHLGRVVCANGGIIWDAGLDQVLGERCFEAAALAAAVTRLRQALPGAGVALLTADTMFLDEGYAALRGKRAEGAHVFSAMEHVLAHHRIVAVGVRHPGRTAEQLAPAAARAFAGVGTASIASADTVDVAPRGVTKDVGVTAEMRAAGCPMGAVVAFGDMPNDLPLFAPAGWACAMANAHPRILEAADEIAPSNDEDGVAHTVARLLRL